MVITSKSNPLVKEFSKLADKKFRKERGLYLVEGTKPVSECVASGGEVETIICTEKLAGCFDGAVIVSDEVFAYISSEKAPQGVIAAVRMKQNKLRPPEKSCILLDRLQDPGNLGTILRTANAAGYGEIYMIGCTDPYSPKAVRASMSGIFFTELFRGAEEEVIETLKDTPLICADTDGEDIFGFSPPEKFCLCIGNEGSGISDAIVRRADFKVKIPMAESCESLNAAVSAGIAMYVLKNLK